jgi:alkanesulfonate monooxygenase SsuD/methylene tetrahydromethanopterin reductase-like flavin-dependent oxidoreductase (luciferase family)
MSPPYDWGMRFGAAYWVQRTGWPELREAVLHAESSGFDDQWVDDHLLSDEGAWQDPKLEGWSTLAAIAAVTRTSRLGLMVAANTFRNPGLTAKLATTLDHLSDGRAILGVGAGWFGREHEAFGLDFGSGFGERLDRLAEAVPLIRRLLDGERVTHEGRFYRFEDAICAPRPIQAHLPILIGGTGPTKTLPLIARSGDIWNAYGRPAELAASDAILRAACAAVARDDQEIERTFNANVVIRATREEARDAWRGWVATHLPQVGEDRLNAFGSVADVATELDRYRAVGFEHPVLVFRAPFDLETMSRLPELRAAMG